MSDKENLDNMAKRYKEEMLRLYRMNGSGANRPAAQPSPPRPAPVNRASSAASSAPADTPAKPLDETAAAVVSCTDGACRFLPPEEILAAESGAASSASASSGETAVPANSTDITDALINGTGFSPGNLAVSGGADCDCITENGSPAVNSGGQRFRGILLRSLYTSPAASSENPLSSDIYAEEIPSYLRLPPDVNADEAIPSVLDSAFAVTDRWNSLTGDAGWGYIQFDISSGADDAPISGATIVISRKSADRTLLSRILSTNSGGLTASAALPSPGEKEESDCTPYAVYSAMIFAKGFYPVYDLPVKIYAGIKTILPIRLISLPAV